MLIDYDIDFAFLFFIFYFLYLFYLVAKEIHMNKWGVWEPCTYCALSLTKRVKLVTLFIYVLII